MRPRQDDVRVVSNAGSAGVAGPAVGFRGGAGFNAGFDEGVHTRGGGVGDRRQPHRPGPSSCTSTAPAINILPSALRLARRPADPWCDAGSRFRRSRPGPPAASGGARPWPGAASRTAARPTCTSRDPAASAIAGRRYHWIGGHPIRRPEPDGQWQLRAMHHRAGGDRGLLAATGALPGEGLARQRPALVVATVRAAEPVGPARVSQICRTRALIREAVLKLDERARKVDHGEPSKQDVRYMFYPGYLARSPHFGAAGTSGISLFHSLGQKKLRENRLCTQILFRA